MNITSGVYSFYAHKVIINVPFEIIKETEKCYFTNGGKRFLKEDIGKPILKSVAQYPYVELIMVNADEETLRDGLSKWFTNAACQVGRMKG